MARNEKFSLPRARARAKENRTGGGKTCGAGPRDLQSIELKNPLLFVTGKVYINTRRYPTVFIHLFPLPGRMCRDKFVERGRKRIQFAADKKAR